MRTSSIPVVVFAFALSASLAAAQALPESFAGVIKKAAPAVVNISSSRVERPQRRSGAFPFPFEFPGPEFGAPRARRATSLGSGVIVSADGSILTNNHVVEGASEITVTLADRREFRAKLVGADPLSDVAVLKIDATGLPTLPLGDSSKVQVGDVVLAIGDPFGLGQTVTMGIVSATGRGGLGIEAYEDFIQTDASINPGNSGGALINARGELIGINTAILSETGGNQGIGFAIPIYMAREIREQIVTKGKVTRGFLGIVPQEITPSLARAFGLKDTRGVAVAEVEPTSPAAKAGIQTGDIITTLNGKPVEDVNTFRLGVSRTPPGTSVRLGLNRQGNPQYATVTLAELPVQRGESDRGTPGRNPRGGSLEGVSVETLSPQIARQLELPADTKGVIAVQIDPASAAAEAGLQRGDVILHVNRVPVSNADEFEREVRRAGNRAVLLLVNRGGTNTFVAVEPRTR